ncbi:MAG TPA: TadE family type IV pilus minor pilin [Jatrophihabitantaceae bacterium]|nr:TadE family type IV pilus minor pilin [Jatrophihabitantaceae bacterium]
MVTLELAACLPVLVLILAVALSAIGVAGARVRAGDAAREAARAATRGDVDAAMRVATAVAPGVHLDIHTSGPDVVVVAHLTARTLANWLPLVEVSARAAAAREP